MLNRFLCAESGAVTVDWVVVTAGAVGLGLGATAAVRLGVINLGGDVRDSLSSASVAALDTVNLGALQLLSSFGFDDGVTTGWNASVLSAIPGFGNVLGPLAGQQLQHQPLTLNASFGAGALQGVISFDMLVLDSWDGSGSNSSAQGDAVTLMINGQPISVQQFMWSGHPDQSNFPGRLDDRVTTVNVNGTDYRVHMTLAQDTQLGNTSRWPDQVWNVTVTANNPPPNVQFGISASTSQNVRDEGLALDNVSISRR